jgi:hypothetical protein
LNVGSQSPRKASRLEREQAKMAATGVFPSFVVPNVPFIHLNLFPYRWEREKSVLLEINKPVFLL